MKKATAGRRQGGHANDKKRDLSDPASLPGPKRAAARQAEYSDAEHKGLSLTVGKTGGNGAGTWAWRFIESVGGKPAKRRIVLGRWPAMDYVAAVQALDIARRDRQKGVSPIIAKEKRAAEKAARLTFAQLVEEHAVPYFATKKRPLDPINLIRRLAVPGIGHLAVDDITTEDIERLIEDELARLKKAGKQGAQANALRAALASTFGLVKKKHIVRNCTFAQPLPHGKPKEITFDSIDQAARFMTEIEAQLQEIFVDSLRLQFLVGARPLEISSLRRSQIVHDYLITDTDPRTRVTKRWTSPVIKWSTTKNGKDHVIPLSRQAYAIVKKRLTISGQEPNAPLFCSAKPGVPIRPTRMANQLQFARRNLDMPENFGPHCLRKSCATILAMLGFGDPIPSLVLNHRPKDVTGRHYNFHAYLFEISAGLQALADVVMPDELTDVKALAPASIHSLAEVRR